MRNFAIDFALVWAMMSGLAITIIAVWFYLLEAKNTLAENVEDCRRDFEKDLTWIRNSVAKHDVSAKLSRELFLRIEKTERSCSNIKMAKINRNAFIPEYATQGSSGLDARIYEDVTIQPNSTVCIGLGIKAELPKGFEFQVRPRSGLSLRTNLRLPNSPGTIDSDYRGEISIIVENTGRDQIRFYRGDAIAQLVLCRAYNARISIVEESDLTSTQRGEGGFGSTDGVGKA